MSRVQTSLTLSVRQYAEIATVVSETNQSDTEVIKSLCAFAMGVRQVINEMDSKRVVAEVGKGEKFDYEVKAADAYGIIQALWRQVESKTILRRLEE